MILALLLLCQDAVEPTKPAAYTDRSSWPVVVDLVDGPAAPPEPEAFVIALKDKVDESFVLACLTDLKTRFRVDPTRVVLRGCGRRAGKALEIAAAHPDLFAACALYRPASFMPSAKGPPCRAFVSKEDADVPRTIAALMVMRKSRDVEVREPGPTLAALALKPRSTLQLADEMQRSGRYLDASLVCIELLDNPEVERLARTKLKSIEGAAIIELAKVEISLSERKVKDAILRCRDAAKQFAWVPSGRKILKRLGELESRPDVKRALETDD